MKWFLLCLVFFIFVIPGQAQNNDSQADFEKHRRDRQALDTAIALSLSSKDLHERFIKTSVSNEEVRILQDAVKSGDRSIVPYLKARRQLGLGPAQHIDIALVALGEMQYFDLAVKESNSEDAATRYWAIWRLARFKTKESYRKLYELLDDNTDRDDGQGDDYVIMPVSWVTKEILSSEFKDAPKYTESTEAWKEWFRKNNLID